MDTGKLKRFAAEARVNLMDGVRLKLRMLGFDENGNCSVEPQLIQGGTLFRGEEYPEAFYHQWKALKERISVHGVREVVEEAAYTWFNRMMAIRILTKNELCEPMLMTDGSASGYPLLLEAARMGRVPEMDAQERRRFDKLMEDDTLTSEQFSLLLTVWCHDNPIINSCFGSINGYAELLLPDNIIRPDGFIALLNNTGFITDDDFKSAELIGWLYQFYISERKDEVMKKQKYAADEIPAATQIFTPNWIVKYMVENTILPQVEASDEILEDAKYLVKNPDATPCKKVELEDLKVADFACGSGHILNECFDLLFALYRDEAYSRKEAIEAIFTKNLIGIDIDLRAKQLAMFTLLLKACQRDASFADAHCLPKVMTVPEMSELVQDARAYLHHFFLGSLSADATKDLVDAWEDLKHSDVLGSIIRFNISPSTRRQIAEAVQHWRNEDFISPGIQAGLPIMDFILALTDSYDAIVMNPPYMGSASMLQSLSCYVKEYYPKAKTDLMTVFMEVAMRLTKINGIWAMINLPSWMFIKSFEQLREELLSSQHIMSLLHLGRGIFGSDFGSVAFVVQNSNNDFIGVYRRLFKEHVQVRSIESIRNLFLNRAYGFYKSNQKNFLKIPGSPIGYWMSDKMLEAFDTYDKLFDKTTCAAGVSSGDNNKYLKLWFEVSNREISRNIESEDEFCNSEYKYAFCNKGGSFRKWYGNNDYVAFWCKSDEFHRNGATYKHLLFKEGITWSAITSSKFSARYYPKGYIFDHAAPSMFTIDSNLLFPYLGFLNSLAAREILGLINPTINMGADSLRKLPVNDSDFLPTNGKVQENINISKDDWDSHETSWDFECSPLISAIKDCRGNVADLDALDEDEQKEILELLPNVFDNSLIEACVNAYESIWTRLFNLLHYNEEELNRKFIEIYGLQDELSPEVSYNEVTILQQGEVDKNANGTLTWHRDVVIQQLISYIVGCYMGRYRLDKSGLAIAHPNPTEDELAEYPFNITSEETFKIDSDAIIPILPEGAPFYDNLVNYVSEFVRKVWGEETHTENMNFIDSCLGKPLNEYLMKDFWKYHKKMYQNRPIYWEFASPKGAFRALVYAHRMDKFTVEVLRSKYLLPYINFIEQKIANLEARATDLSTAERRELDNLRKKTLPELREYHDRVQQVAAETAARDTVFDLDDGIIKNHTLFGSIVTKLK